MVVEEQATAGAAEVVVVSICVRACVRAFMGEGEKGVSLSEGGGGCMYWKGDGVVAERRSGMDEIVTTGCDQVRLLAV